MADRDVEGSAAYGALSDSGKAVLHVIERRAGHGVVAISLEAIGDATDLSRSAIRHGIRRAEALGFISVTLGPRHNNQFQISDGWRDVETADEAARRMKLAKEPTPPRPASAPPKPVRQVKARIEVEQQPVVRQVPSLATVQWLGR
jgi:hypothetical protein